MSFFVETLATMFVVLVMSKKNLITFFSVELLIREADVEDSNSHACHAS